MNDSSSSSNTRKSPQQQQQEALSSASSARVPQQVVRQQQQPQQVSPRQLMAAMGTSPRRIVLSALSATGIALAGNFVGITSNLLNQFPEDVIESTGLDTYYPRGDYKRYKSSFGYTLVIPKQWVADTSLELAKAQQRAKALDYTSASSTSSATTRKSLLPDAAFGPPGSGGGGGKDSVTNVSVLVTPVGGSSSSNNNNAMMLPLTTKSLGSPDEAANTYMVQSLAPPGSGRVATILSAIDRDGTGTYYELEYTVKLLPNEKVLRSISVITFRTNNLITLTVVAPETEWNDSLVKIAKSFHVTE